MRFPPFLLLLFLLVLVPGCSPQPAPQIGRYQFHRTEMMILDTATGDTYVAQNGRWDKVPKFPGHQP